MIMSMTRVITTALLTTCALTTVGCLPWLGVLPEQGAVGTTSRGVLSGGGHLPKVGDHFRFYRGGDRRWGVHALTGAIERASARVAEVHPGSVLQVGDISAEPGGFISGHSSHRSGRDVDFAFYMNRHTGEDAALWPLIRFDRFGIGVRGKGIYHFDTPRNWELVEALLRDDEAEMQWIFVSRGLKARLMAWAIENDRDIEIIKRSASVLKQPGDSAPHDDHFHVRIYCPRDREGAYCVDKAPIWPWIDTAPPDSARFTREELLGLALEN
jgi:penicillin-insensitive murein endopeptidase